jgi:NodT family efflux transporter outer membrane factor (OMF) lipoprotein
MRYALLLLGALTLSGCMVGPDFHEPKPGTPPAWVSMTDPPPPMPTTIPSTQATTEPTTQSTASMTEAQVAQWWWNFDDPQLNSLIERAIDSNIDVKLAEARIRQARASRGVVASAFWPTVNTNASYTRSDTGRGANVQVTTTPGGGTSTARISTGKDLYAAGLDAAWELDIFGGVRRDIEASEADIQAAIEDRRDVLVTLTSEVALNYLDLRGFQRQLAIARQNLAAQQYTADLTRRRQRGGFVSALDVAQADAQVAATLSQIPLLEQSARQAIYSLSVLLAREPAALVEELSSGGAIPPVPPEVPVGLPSDLLRRRPDVRRAEAQLHAATARIGVATADLFPRFSLSGALNVQGSKVKDLANWNNAFWSFGPAVSWPLFSAGRIRSNIGVQNALTDQALLSYEQTVLTALQEVENALVAYAQEQQHREALRDAVAANRRAVDLAQLLYSQGQTGFLDVLTAQRSLYASEDALVQSERTIATNLVALYKGLGGGWESAEPQNTR